MGVRFLSGGLIGSEDAWVFGNYMEHQGQGRPPVKGGHRLVFSFSGGAGGGLHSVGMADATWLSSLQSSTDRHEALRYNVNIFGLGGD